MSMSMSMAMAGRRCEGVGLEVIVVGGSIAGLCCAHSILHHAAASTAVSVTVTVLERSRSFTTAAAGGAGLGLDPVSCNSALQRWLGGGILHHSLPLSSEEVHLHYTTLLPQTLTLNPYISHHIHLKEALFLTFFLCLFPLIAEPSYKYT